MDPAVLLQAEEPITILNKKITTELKQIENGSGPKNYVKLRSLIDTIEDVLDSMYGKIEGHKVLIDGYNKLLKQRVLLDKIEKKYLYDERTLFYEELQESKESNPLRRIVLLISPENMEKRAKKIFPKSSEAIDAYKISSRSLMRRILPNSDSVERERLLYEYFKVGNTEGVNDMMEDNTDFMKGISSYFNKLLKFPL